MHYLFVGHSAKGTGAPRSFLTIIETIKSLDSNFSCDIILIRDGELKDKYRRFGKVTVLQKYHKQRVLNRPFYFIQRVSYQLKVKAGHYDVLVANSTLSWFFIRNIDFASFQKCLIRIPEGRDTLLKILSSEKPRFISQVTKYFTVITPSIANKSCLKEVIPDAKFKVMYGVQTRVDYSLKRPADSFQQFIRGKFVIGGAGRFVTQKGIDLFFKVAEDIVRIDSQFVFVWVGGPAGFVEGEGLSNHEERLRSELEATGTLDNVLVIPFNPTPEYYFQSFDLFFLSSRWDPFPLTVLENAELGVPTICYNNAGGAPEFVGDSCGIVVDFESVKEVVDSIICIQKDTQKLNLFSENCIKSVKKYDRVYLKNELCSILNIG